MSRFSLLVAVGLFTTTAAAFPAPRYDKTTNCNETNPTNRTNGLPVSVKSWSSIKPSTNLVWVDCFDDYGDFECAVLQVPLDYSDPSVGTTDVHWVRQTAVNGTGQDVIYNPGGPGQSGVQAVIAGGDELIASLGGQYNIVSFDPRGVNNSDITLTCFPENQEAKNVSQDVRGHSIKYQIPELYQISKAHGELCTAAIKNTTAKYASTAANVLDMVHFTELQATLNGQNPKEAKIWYFGISYGTLMGQTLAQMFPHRLGRVVLDANVNGVEHYAGYVPSTVEDTDKAYAWFFELCAQAGPTKCAYARTSKTAKEIEIRFRALLAQLQAEPIIVHQKEGQPSLVTRNDVLLFVFNQLYSPMYQYPSISRALTALEDGNVTEYFQVAQASSARTELNPVAESYDPSEALGLITAVDAAGNYPLHNATIYVAATGVMKNASYYGGEIISRLNSLINAGLEIIPPESQHFSGFGKVKTSVPILFVGTTGDPVTPLSSAFRNAAFFEGAGVLTQNTPGHSMTSVPSSCTLKFVAAYMEDGTLPPRGTICQGDRKPLVDGPSEVQKRALFL
ncbi:hypothetical protein B0J11DRAFT_618722 [Dendryphion nanum]|uniref:Peptidase S33 tripeptidyl aminopeptidase-like C-terminal domain-containing protein n=1 Tax=Dendryphion nanum TaxID=256645 RepID=A0A9P9IBB6_9PLEO|nr:hypothetical protein B0J11DRAFT_618722 [Dendryphion nanum]